MPINPERGGCRFVIAKTDEGKPMIQLELFHDTLSRLKGFKVGFEVPSGATADQARALTDAMNERIVGVIVTPNG
jgi:hypothetical protein